jgi:hypothetical protein
MSLSTPLGLPDGSIRGLIALACTGAVLFLFITGQVVPDMLMTVASLVIGYYFGARSGGIENTPQPEPLPAPYIPGEDETG